MTVTTTNLDYLLPFLRLRIGDTVSGSYRYTDEWLQTALVSAVWALHTRWSGKYLIDANNDVERNTDMWVYTYDSPPVVEAPDFMPIIIMAAIIVLEGSLENLSWNVGSWKDAEISYSNIQSGRTKETILGKLFAELESYLIPATKKLKRSLKGSLVGYQGNVHESGQDY